MNTKLYVLFIILCGLISVNIALYLQRVKREKAISAISATIKHIILQNTDEKVMHFSEDPYIVDLMASINMILEDRQKIKAEYRKAELSSKRMLSNISHDIKTPLTVILGYSEILSLNEAPSKKTIEKINKKTREVISLINKFFTLAKIESEDMDLTMEQINICELCREIAVDFYQILTEKNFKVEVNIPNEDIFISGNQEAIKRILNNLISNSIRYGYEGNYLSISIYQNNLFAYVDITDKGKGIDKASVNNVFDRLYTSDDSRNLALGGNGLGLAIAKSLAEKLGGSLTLRSIPYESTTFSLKLKLINY